MNDTRFESCIKCTVCTTTCPVSRVNPRYPGPKQAGPDGERLRLKDGALYDEALKYCINCKRCEVACPSDVKIGDIIQRARAQYGQQKPTLRDAILSHTDLMGTLSTPFAPLVNAATGLKPVRRLLDATLNIDHRRTLPKYGFGTFRRAYRQLAARQKQYSEQVAFFHGCYVNYNHPQLGKDLIRVVNALGTGVQLLSKEKCCGVPLIEMVTRPDLHSSAEAKEFLEMIKTTLSYLDICDCKMEEGSIRCDVNVSIRPEGSTELGTRVEMKNINTFSGAVRAIDYEIARQIEVVENGGEIQQETRRWDDVKLKNTVMRTKEDAQDYRYFPDPDLIAVEISDEWLHQIESEVPELPITRYERYLNEYGMTAMEARLLSDSFEKAELLDAAAKQVKPKAAANWILSDISKYLNDKGVSLRETKMTADKLVALVKLIEAGTISGNAGKKVLPSMFETDETVEAIVDRMGLKQVSDEGAILAIVQDVIAKNEKAVADFKAGKNVTGFLVGQCMKASKGQGNPQIINKLIASELAKL